MNFPKWLDNVVFYEIYPQSFQDSNADGIGDFQGIIDRLDYIRELGCSAIWMNPCFASPFGDAGYDVSDYYRAAPRYGTNEDLKRLFDEVHARDMHILLDLVPGHTSVQHSWFQESMKAEKNPYTDRYIWTDSVWEEPEGYASLRGISPRDGSCVVNFFSHQPALNYGYYKPDPNKKWQQGMDAPGPRASFEAMLDVMSFWLRMGCDGFRVDMAGAMIKGDEDGKGTIQFWQRARKKLDEEFPEAVLVSEWGEPDKSLQAGFHMDFLLHFGPSHYNDLFRCESPYFSGQGDASAFVKKYTENLKKANGNGLICIPSGNHDMDRLARTIQGMRQKISFAFLLSMPGAPFLYYGDEIGMRYVEDLVSVEGGYSRTGSRSPMQWDDTLNAGFSRAPSSALYVPLDPDPHRPNVKHQMETEDSLWNEIKRLISIRSSHPALQSRSAIQFVCAEPNTYPLAYLRSCAQERILVALNPSDQEAGFPFDGILKETIYCLGTPCKAENGRITLPPCSASYLLLP